MRRASGITVPASRASIYQVPVSCAGSACGFTSPVPARRTARIGLVEFIARRTVNGRPKQLHEEHRFVREEQ
jgi:hypothetical protein